MSAVANDQMPQGWVAAPLGELVDLNPKAALSDDTKVGFVPMPSIGTGFLEPIHFESRLWKEVKKGYTHFQDEDVLLAKITPCFENGKGALVSGLPNGAGAGSTEYFVCRPKKEALNAKYLHAFFKTPKFMTEAETQMSGSVGHKRVPKEHVVSTEIPLAPLAEQKRIADKLEAVLGRVDACRARLDRVPDLLKRFRQSVLAAATSGQLTEDWRKAHAVSSVQDSIDALGASAKTRRGVSDSVGAVPEPLALWECPSGWAKATAGQLISKGIFLDVKDGNHGSNHPKVSEFTSDGLPFITAAQVRDFRIDYDDAYKIEGEPLSKLRVGFAKADDVILTHKGTVGRVAVADRDCILTPQTTYYRVNPEWLEPKYLMYFLASPAFGNQLDEIKSQTTRDFVPISQQYSLGHLIPTLPEQAEIVRRVEALFALADRIEARLATAQRLVERLTPATLSKAFRGDLVPQDPNDEPASKLLERLSASTQVKSKRAKSN